MTRTIFPPGSLGYMRIQADIALARRARIAEAIAWVVIAACAIVGFSI